MTIAETAATANKLVPDETETVRDYVRRELVHRTLGPLVTADELQVADVGGGSGRDAAWLAWLGHRVALVDPSPDQLDLARRRRSLLPADVAERITLWQGTARQFLEDDGRSKYDLVLAHEVAAYADNPEAFIKSALRLVRSGGHASFLERGFGNAWARVLHTGNYQRLEYLRRSGRVADRNGGKVWTVTPERFAQIARTARPRSQVTHYGVCITNDLDERPLETIGDVMLTRIIDLQAERGRNPAFRATAPYLQFVVHMQLPMSAQLKATQHTARQNPRDDYRPAAAIPL